MATTDLTTITDKEARMRAFQILGSDIDHTWTGGWRNNLIRAAAVWAGQAPVTAPTDSQTTPAA
jgi:hypothetical protein